MSSISNVLTNIDLFSRIANEKKKILYSEDICKNVKKNKKNNIEELSLLFKIVGMEEEEKHWLFDGDIFECYFGMTLMGCPLIGEDYIKLNKIMIENDTGNGYRVARPADFWGEDF